ncbi:protein-disulfide reductase DsbD family protein [Novipirellula artificiosorum]|uniref:Thiol:disulfide interchange protein DsbD n=1 Tax=Novipirellula artificiosorum TaxID=2528016 RepID=A0A5C6DJY5_9BACT|nr:thioredoxin family protein [Novipirellula artificiosorum]TWU37150.1 Thiol:disulfide interchange protein DsbD precursor [Novipirellula artificiosorum]
MIKTIFSFLAPFALLAALVSPPLVAQDGFDDNAGLFSDFSLGGFGQPADESTVWTAKYFATQDGVRGRLDVEVKISRGWHVYSVTQPPGGPLQTKLTIKGPDAVKLAGEFTPSEPPLKSVSTIFKGVTIEEHDGLIVWSVPILIPDGFRDAITVGVDAQACKTDGACVPIEESLVALFAGTIDQVASHSENNTVAQGDGPTLDGKMATAAPQQTFRDEDYQVAWTAGLVPSTVAPGGRALLTFTAKPDSGFHVYRAAVDDADSSTNFVMTEKAGLRVGAPAASSEPHESNLLKGIFYHDGNVSWTMPVEVPEDAKPGEHKIKGAIGYQACTDSSCQQPVALQFSTNLTVGQPDSTSPRLASVVMTSAKRADVLDAAAMTQWVDKDVKADGTKPQSNLLSDDSDGTVQPIVIDGGGDRPFALLMMFAFLGGLILNVMPCVLPVVGIKVMGFIQQAGADRKRVFWLNAVYAAGILVVFALLTVLAVVFGMAWGEHFQRFEFRLGMTVLVFALALSYFGFWEIPVPGMASGKLSQDLQKREGYPGAFFKGAFATVLSTPCSGPALGVVFPAVASLPPLQATALMMMVGVGMAFPYILIGIWPSLVAWLPKPGTWMETFKELMAFLLLGTVAFFFFMFSDEVRLPVFVTLIGVWFGCWIIGKVPNWADLRSRMIAWAGGIVSATVIGMMAFHYLESEPATASVATANMRSRASGELDWEPYNEARLQELQQQGRTVMVDFTARWCPNCIFNSKVALNTEPTRKMVEELNAVPMLADWTNRNLEIKSKLEELQSRSIPVLAIYPGSRPNQPIVLRDLVSQSAVLKALEQAGPSVPGSSSSIATQLNVPQVVSTTVH